MVVGEALNLPYTFFCRDSTLCCPYDVGNCSMKEPYFSEGFKPHILQHVKKENATIFI